MKKVFLTVTLISIFTGLFAQEESSLKEKVLKRYDFEEHIIPLKDDTIFFYVHKNKGSNPKNLVLYLQGTAPEPGPYFGIKKTPKGYSYAQYYTTDYKLLDDNYAFVLIAYPGTPVVEDQGEINMTKYHQLNSLDYRVFQADTVINYVSNELIKNLNKVIVYGHSEGAPVAAKLGTINNKITHLGFWGGNALPDFFDFILFERKALLSNEIAANEANKNINDIIETFNKVAEDSTNIIPSNKNEIHEYTNKRWWSYAEPPINNLIKLDVPLYVQVATNDESAPIESAYLIPLEFMRLGKKNLTFNVCNECNHGFAKMIDGKEVDLWSDIFIDFINWTNN